jgi:hypothetical protein
MLPTSAETAKGYPIAFIMTRRCSGFTAVPLESPRFF